MRLHKKGYAWVKKEAGPSFQPIFFSFSPPLLEIGSYLSTCCPPQVAHSWSEVIGLCLLHRVLAWK